MTDEVMIHIRLPKALIKAVDHAAVDAELSRSETVESMLRFAVERRLSEARTDD